MGMPTDKPRITSQNSETSIGDDIIAGSPDELGDSAQDFVMRLKKTWVKILPITSQYN